MSYRQTPGNYRSHATRRNYPFREGDHVDRRRAKAAMEHDDATYQNAEAQRVANIPAETRSRADVVRSEIQHKSQSSGEPGGVMSARLAELQRSLALTSSPNDKARIQRRINALQLRSDAHTAVVDAKAAREALASSPEVVAAIVEAQELLDGFRFRGDVAESVVQGAAAALESLKSNLDVAAFKATAAELRSQHNQARQATMAQLRATIKQQEAELMIVKADAAPPEATTVAAE